MMGDRPHLLDLFCGAGGAAKGYADAGFDVTGVDIKPQPHYPYGFIQADALDYLREHGHEYDAIHASPPCQGYSIMRNLPWLRGKEYPLLIDPTRELLEATGRPWVIENVMGAKLPAGWLCGTMFGKRFYRHRAFEANWLWLAPPHARHRITILPRGRANNHQFVCPDELVPNHRGPGRTRNMVWTDETPLGVIHPGRFLGPRAQRIVFGGDTPDTSGEARRWQDSALDRGGVGVGVGHAAGAVEARREMGCEWMTRDEMGQAIPPVYTAFIGAQLRRYLDG